MCSVNYNFMETFYDAREVASHFDNFLIKYTLTQTFGKIFNRFFFSA